MAEFYEGMNHGDSGNEFARIPRPNVPNPSELYGDHMNQGDLGGKGVGDIPKLEVPAAQAGELSPAVLGRLGILGAFGAAAIYSLKKQLEFDKGHPDIAKSVIESAARGPLL